jgi:two-component sensor histidine kinase
MTDSSRPAGSSHKADSSPVADSAPIAGSSPTADSTAIPEKRLRRFLGIRLRYWKWWLITTVALVIFIFWFRAAMDLLRMTTLPARTVTFVLASGIIYMGLCSIALVAIFAHLEKRALSKLGIDADAAYDQNIFDAAQSATCKMTASREEAMRCAEDALTEYGALITRRDDASGRINALTPQCWRSFGDKIEIVVSGGQTCVIEIHARARIYPLKFITDFGRSWEHVQALATRMATGTFPAALVPAALSKVGAMDSANLPPSAFEAGQMLRVWIHCPLFFLAILGMLRPYNHAIVAMACATGVLLELFAYFKFREQARRKLRTELQENFEVLLTNTWPALLVFVALLRPLQSWSDTRNIAAIVTVVAFVFLTVTRLRDKQRERVQRAQMVAGREKAELQRQLAEAKLVALSAQIEPHFLFNTLASIQYLIRNDSGKASEMTSDLIRYLRLALPRMKQATARLADELKLVRAYLGIMQIRMDARLQFAIDSPDELADVQIPTMTLITLAENAIKHGLEQKEGGGMINIVAMKGQAASESLRLEVADTGGGFSTTVSGSGIGLANIRERLNSLYGARARLELEANQPSGVKAILIMPIVRT